ncbi:MAG: 16S rRNA (uracil(1498)-N(3))-methyltransferase [Flavobacteriales bacterium]|nr:16S rRNA (uracil(1498)-N(3))-methyltransferase [Flavobacteriales bacterium]
MNLFYHPDISVGSQIEFESGESIHISKVLRKQTGDILDITDGQGHHAKASIVVGKKSVVANIESIQKIASRPFYLELCIAPTKNNERTEWFVEKAVEIGIEKITLVHCKHSERPHLKTERLHKVAISAMKQSLKFHLPEISGIIPFHEWIAGELPETRCIAHCMPTEKKLLRDVLNGKKSACIAIGPEGDFSAEEIEQALSKQFIAVSLGQSRLRTETAALAAVHTFEVVHQ